MRLTFLLLTCVLAAPCGAAPVDRLDAVADELDRIVADLDAAQTQTAELRGRLAAAEALSEEHQRLLHDQAALEHRYEQTVADLEAHDQAALSLAEDLKHQLESERRLTGWVLPAAGVVLAAALVEGWLLAVR
jgi:septal ring factor EnvC (AmiA/AmiB activator)